MKNNLFESALSRIQKLPEINYRIHSERHEVIDKMRQYFGETAVKGKGSFGFYLRMLEPIPLSIIYMWLAEIKDSPKLDTPIARAKIFWWKFKQFKNQK